MVHCQQVHKVEPDKLPNTLPGRDGYDIEIFGMEGVPAKDQAEWKAKKEAEFGGGEGGAGNDVNGNRVQGPKRPRIYKGVIPEADLQVALAQHKALMSGKMAGGPGAPGQGQGQGQGFPPHMQQQQQHQQQLGQHLNMPPFNGMPQQGMQGMPPQGMHGMPPMMPQQGMPPPFGMPPFQGG